MNETQTELLIQYLRKINDNLERIANTLEKENTATENSDVISTRLGSTEPKQSKEGNMSYTDWLELQSKK